MGECRKIETCSFFGERMHTMPSIAALFKKRLCQGEYSGCARYYLYNYLDEKKYEMSNETEATIAELSSTLFPNEFNRVKTILQNIDMTEQGKIRR
jgi:hypothetical protein